MAGLRLPIESHPLQALVSEPLKPVLDTVVMSNAVHVYVSQSDKGELVIGAGIDAFNSYAQRGRLHVIEQQIGGDRRALPDLQPAAHDAEMGRHRRHLPGRQPDHQQDAGRGLYFNCGWGTGGFKATPGSGHVFAHTIAKDEPHPLAAPFRLERFQRAL